jgi:hypothetical protein
VLQDSNGALYKARVERLPQPPPTHPLNEVGDPPTAIDNLWNQKKEDGSYTNVKCFDNETSFDWCGGLQAYSAIERTRKGAERTVYHVNTRRPEVSKPGIKFLPGDIEASLVSADRLLVNWPKAITQPPGNPVKYELTLWDRANCPKDNNLCDGHSHNPNRACNQSQTQCEVTLSRCVPPLTAETLKSISVVAKDLKAPPGTPNAQKEVNFTAPPPKLGAIQQEIRVDQKDLKELSQVDVPHDAGIRRWLHVQLQVLQARLAHPDDDVLTQIDQSLGTEPRPLSKADKQGILARLHARLSQLGGG